MEQQFMELSIIIVGLASGYFSSLIFTALKHMGVSDENAIKLKDWMAQFISLVLTILVTFGISYAMNNFTDQELSMFHQFLSMLVAFLASQGTFIARKMSGSKV